MESKGRIILIICIIILIIVSGWFFIFKKICKDEECFNEALAYCKPAKFYSYRNNNLYYYKISRSIGKCRLYIRVDKMAIGSDPDTVRLLQGKNMRCKIPRNVMVSLDEMKDLLIYCHGELKEGMYQMMLERLYALVARDMESVVEEAEKALGM